MTRVFTGVDDLAGAVGEHLGWSAPLPVTQAMVDRFADLTGDRQWIHTDPERAAAGPFGGPIVHGLLTLALVPALLAQVYRIEGLAMAVNYGTERVRFPAALPVGSPARAGVRLASLEPAAQGWRMVVTATVQAPGAPKPACVADLVALLVPA